jgi:hypothetical protein
MVGRAGIEPAVVRLKGGFISFDDCDPELAHRAGFEPASCRLTAGRLASYTTCEQKWQPRADLNCNSPGQSRRVLR